MMYSLSLTLWLTAFLGAGTLASIPSSILLLANMGVVVGRRQPELRQNIEEAVAPLVSESRSGIPT
jgi:hypothetical protein